MSFNQLLSSVGHAALDTLRDVTPQKREEFITDMGVWNVVAKIALVYFSALMVLSSSFGPGLCMAILAYISYEAIEVTDHAISAVSDVTIRAQSVADKTFFVDHMSKKAPVFRAILLNDPENVNNLYKSLPI